MQLNQNSPIPFYLVDKKTVAVCDPEDFHRVSQYRWHLFRFKDGNPLNVTKRNLIAKGAKLS